MRKTLWVSLCAGAALALSAGAFANEVKPHPGMLRYPAVSKDRVCFVYGNDLWMVSREGGTATPLSSPPGAEAFPRFSPDGQTLAFNAFYDGGRDIYTMPVSGGPAMRVTYHPAAETVAGWTPDGRILYMTNGFSGLARQTQLWTTGAEGGLPTKVDVPYAGFGAISPDGRWLVYTPHSTDHRTWKRYRGGMATDLWLYNLQDHSAKRITDWEGTDTLPMWNPAGDGSSVYYLSDNGPEHRLNIWRYDVQAGTREQVTKYEADDVRYPSVGPGDKGQGEIVFQLGAKLMLLDLGTRQAREVPVTIPGDRPRLRERTVDASKFFHSASISPSGKRVVMEARGDLWSAPVKEGSVRAITRTDGIAERDPAWSPDGKWIAYFSDETGENELWVRASDARPEEQPDDEKRDKDAKDAKNEDASGRDQASKAADTKVAWPRPEPRKLTNLGAGYRFSPTWSPDSRRIVTVDQNGRIFLTNVETGETREFDKDPWMNQPTISWSSDSRWFAYPRADEGNSQMVVWIGNAETGEKRAVTSAMFNCGGAAFDRKGDFLFVRSNRAVSNPIYGDLDTTFVYTGTDTLLMIPLRKDVKNPWLPKSDEEFVKPDSKKDDAKKDEPKKDGEKPDDEKKKDESKESGKDAKDSKDGKSKPVEIDFDGIERRAMPLPVPAGAFGRLAVADGEKLVYVRLPARGSTDVASIKLFEYAADERSEKNIGAGSNFELTHDGKKMLVFRDGGDLAVLEVAENGGKAQNVGKSGMTVAIQPMDEWKQIFNDAWRVMRDYFYVASMHGVDWEKMREHYGAMLDDAGSREDVNWIISEMISELNIGHAYLTAPGDVEQVENRGAGLLGCDFEVGGAGGVQAYRIGRIYEGAPWDSDARGPLSQPGVNVKVGDYLLAVDGIPVSTKRDPWAALVGKADRVVTLTVSDKPVLDGDAREVVVKTLKSEVDLRYRAWIEHNRKYVEDRTGGRIGYIYVPNTGIEGQDDLFRQFFGQRDKAGLIIDERWNGGGQIPNRFIELLNRPATNYWARRDGKDWTWPPDSHQGPLVMLANGLAGSGGDMFPWLFKHHRLGTLIGTRTWGGLVGISGNPGFIDNGSISVPTFGFYETDGTWGIEGHGVDPDIEVLDDPSKMVGGRDPQLDKAIEVVTKAVQDRPYTPPARPRDPDRSGMGLPDTDK